MKNIQLPQEWLSVLGEIRQYFPCATIAGGALRDLDHDRQPKDVDVFVPISDADMERYNMLPETCADVVEHMLRRVFGHENIKLIAASTYHNRNDDLVKRDLYAVFQLLNKSITYEFVIGTPEACDPRQFDLSICQIMLAPDNSIWRGDYYVVGDMQKKIYVTSINRVDRQAKRMERILSKYPEFSNGGETHEARIQAEIASRSSGHSE